MYDIAIGDLRLSREEFERMTWGEFQCMYRGHIREQERRLHETRLIMWAAVRPHSKKKIKPEDLLPLPMDSRAAIGAEKISKERYNELKEKWLSAN